MLLAAAATAAGLAVLGTVAAQAPPGPLPKGAAPTAPARPAGQVPPGVYPPPQPAGAGVGAKPAGYLQTPPPAGSTPVRPRLTSPVVAGPDGVRPAGAEVPPPGFDPPPARPGALPPVVTLPPPSISQDTEPPKLPPTPPVDPPAGVPGLPAPFPGPAPESTNPRPLVPVPPAGGGVIPPPVVTPVPGDTAVSPGAVPAPAAALPGKVTHAVTLEAVCPESVVFGEEVRYELVVRNGGTAAVVGVRVEDEVPPGAKYVGSDPPAEAAGDRLAWAVGTLEPGAERRIAVRLRPADEGELRSRATVTCAAAVEARTKVTRPRVGVAVTGPDGCKAGERAVFKVKVANTGTGPAKNLVVQAFLSPGLVYQDGPKPEQKLELVVASLPPGETKTVDLPATATGAGAQWCQVTVATPGNPDASARAAVTVVEPQLKVAQTGPARCLVRAEPVYEITLSNPGTAPTDPVTVYTLLPEGFEFVQGSDGAAYSAPNRAVVWKTAGLAPGKTQPLTLRLRAAAATDGLLRTVAQAGGGDPNPPGAVAGAGGIRPAGRVLEAKADTAVKAEGVAAVRFEVAAVKGVIEVGKEEEFEIRVTNQGTGPCTNVQLVAALADGLAYTGSSGPTQVRAQGQNLFVDPIPTLPVKGEMVYRVKARGAAAGDLRVRVQLTCDQARTPVVKEESTRFVKE
ncbi:MAG: hypothetical protein C0501_03905 [Isosphaera sp.]|nr:hypothetical protein [Isosphaera sp.]